MNNSGKRCIFQIVFSQYVVKILKIQFIKLIVIYLKISPAKHFYICMQQINSSVFKKIPEF